MLSVNLFISSNHTEHQLAFAWVTILFYHLNLVYTCCPWSFFKSLQHLVHTVFRALEQGFNIAGVQISHPALQAKFIGIHTGEMPKPNSLNPSAYHKFHFNEIHILVGFAISFHIGIDELFFHLYNNKFAIKYPSFVFLKDSKTMTLTQLSYIIAVDKYRHFATAAEKSYVTQPTLSMQIHKLEEELGITIFDRSKSPVVPTEVGEKIISQAKAVLKESKQLSDIANFKENELRGTFKIGIIPTIAPYLVPLFIRSFMKQYPLIDLVFEELLTQEVLEKLGTDQIDAGIIATPADQSFIYTEELYVEPFVGYLSHSHPLTEKDKLTVDDLNRSNIWLLREGHCLRDQAVQLCKDIQDHKDPSIEFKSGNLETLKRLVEQNFGMTLLPWTAVNELDNECSNAVIKEFDDPVPSRKVRLIYGRKHLKKTIIEAFKKSICDSIPKNLKNGEERVLLE